MSASYDYRNIRGPQEAESFGRGYNDGYFDAKKDRLREGDMRVAQGSDNAVSRAWGQGYERGALDWITAKHEKRVNFLWSAAGAIIAIAFVAILVYLS